MADRKFAIIREITIKFETLFGVTFRKVRFLYVKVQGNSALLYALPLASTLGSSLRMVINKSSNMVPSSKYDDCMRYNG